ncbi:MAG: hypothetical protein IJN42_02445 [Clostridia bacterium]|nr:hypothetical protein [Clostridia bacterium]
MAEFAKKEGRRIRGIEPMQGVGAFIMPDRNGASNWIRDTVETERIDEYINQKKAQGLKNFNFMHVIIAAYVRVVAKRPALNRFIRGQRIYARNGIEICITIKKEMKLESPDTCVKIPLTPDCTADDVYYAFEKVITDYRNEPKSSFDDVAKILNYIPAVLLRFVVKMLKSMDYIGLLPRFLTKLSPFHGSLFITSMGSLGIPVIYHHLYDFGNLPLFVAFGSKYKKLRLQKDGSVREVPCIDFTLVMDERICDGYYYANVLKQIRILLDHPERLDQPPEKVVPDIK